MVYKFISSKLNISKRHLAKSLTWRFFGTIDTVLISYFITKTVEISIGIGIYEIFSKIFLYYFHEIIWFKKIRKYKNRHLFKTISWRIVAVTDTILISLVLTGDGFLGIKIGIGEIVTKSALYYIHEKIWYKIKYGIINE